MDIRSILMLSNELIRKYLLSDDLSTYDPYDIWKTSLGIKVKQLYYQNKYLGLIPAGFLTIYDLYFNNGIHIGYKKQEYQIVRAQAALALLNLYKKEPKPIYLEYMKKHIDWLIKNSSQGYNGACWGTGFKIVISATLIYDETVPFSTNTPYILESLYEYFKITGDATIFEVIQSIYDFYEKDIVILQEDEDILITSYGPFKDRIVTNAVSYTMFAYSIFYGLFDNKKKYIAHKIEKMMNFVASVQREDGSWIYAPYDTNSFIDCFHSAFVLKNIIKTSKNIEIELKNKLINSGYMYIKENFLDESFGLFKRFSISNKPSLTKFDLYDNAEMLYLAMLMDDSELLKSLEKNIEIYFHSNINIYSLIDMFKMRKNKNTLRWAVMPYLLAKSL